VVVDVAKAFDGVMRVSRVEKKQAASVGLGDRIGQCGKMAVEPLRVRGRWSDTPRGDTHGICDNEVTRGLDVELAKPEGPFVIVLDWWGGDRAGKWVGR
jgi:hypothetical protein